MPALDTDALQAVSDSPPPPVDDSMREWTKLIDVQPLDVKPLDVQPLPGVSSASMPPSGGQTGEPFY